MDYFKERRQNRQEKPRPPGRLASAWHSFVNVVFYCILTDIAVDNFEVPDEAAKRMPSRQASPLSLDPLNANHREFHNRSAHEPRHSNWSGTHPFSVHASDSASASGCSEGKDLESKRSSGKRSWLSRSWSRISNRSDSSEETKQDQGRCSPPQWRPSGTDMVDQRRAVKCSFEDNLSIQDLERVNSPGSSGIVLNGDGSWSGSVGDRKSLASCASAKEDGKTGHVKDVENKTGKGKTKKVDVTSGNSWTSISSNGGKSKKVQPQVSVKTETKGSKWPVSDRFDVAPGGTILDVYKLIKRILNLGIPELTAPSTPVAPPKIELLKKASYKSVKVAKQKEQREAGIPWTKTPSIQRLHTEWDEDIINIEVLLGLKKPKNSREALAVMKQLGPGVQLVVPDNSTDVSDSTVVKASLNEGSKPAVEDVDSGVASRGGSDTTN